MAVRYVDDGKQYPYLNQPPGYYVRKAEDEFDGEEVTWPLIHKRAWELQRADDAVETESDLPDSIGPDDWSLKPPEGCSSTELQDAAARLREFGHASFLRAYMFDQVAQGVPITERMADELHRLAEHLTDAARLAFAQANALKALAVAHGGAETATG